MIVELINMQVKTTVAELCSNFGVSPATIRNDIRELEFAGLLKRTHSGTDLKRTERRPLFFGGKRMSFGRGIITPNMEQAQVKKKPVDFADEVILLLDSTKLGIYGETPETCWSN